ncbi:MAG: FAD-binding protein, partial [Betaproteobacteria bacterium]|nr:FAD-binding protein [Betaproteobacteria bacterium]
MAILVIAEHDGKQLKPGTTNTVTAAAKIGGDLTVLVAGSGCAEAAQAAAKIAGVGKVLLADAAQYAGSAAENLAALVQGIAGNYSHILAPATGYGKNFMPRLAALLDVQQISDISAVVSPDTFVRPIYAGNAMATVQSADKVKVITVRATGFDAAGEGGSAAVENLAAGPDTGLSKFNGQELSKSDRPELTAARIIVSGGRGMGSGENFKILEALADKLGAAVGAS